MRVALAVAATAAGVASGFSVQRAPRLSMVTETPSSPEQQSRKHFLKNIVDADLESGRFSGLRTRFPPEPNGYLHIGHAKSINLNFGLGIEYSGATNMRFDDTNPVKEDMEYVNAILSDVRWLRGESGAAAAEPWAGDVRHSSDYFDVFYKAAEYLIEQGLAYVDTLTAEEMKEYRGTLTEPGKDSPDRSRAAEESLEMFRQMRDGELPEGAAILRAKIDMASPNLNMRDPAIYRVRHAEHPITGDAWKIYPMYDFAHCISDALEEITHSICTLEFQDHRPLYDWFLEKLLPSGLLPQSTLETLPRQYEFSRLNLEYTVLSKRKLIQLVQGRKVDGWDDPRMPTICGIRRRGFTPSAMRLFCERIGVSKVDGVIDVAVLEDCARTDLDAASPRAFALQTPLKVTISNWDDCKVEEFEVPRHPKREELGSRTLPFGKTLYIDAEDFNLDPPKGYNRLSPGGRVRLKYAYVIECDEVVKDDAGNVVELVCSYIPETRAGATPEGMKKVRGIVQWLSAEHAVPAQLQLYDRLFKTASPGAESGDFLNDLNPNSLISLDEALVEPSVKVSSPYPKPITPSL
uniref:glutamine--tRNA ligase n=1 Tax=Phaeomonas parva TaxID=124430 RepID=A0A7S1TWZ5_9STRA|mmetsp:Transcript_20939/g.63808  ORF Transcript_20939/g.63808 Transcript_20939/m.63808 type:complete len:577 (+) Transcript_20939:125-1855(+)